MPSGLVYSSKTAFITPCPYKPYKLRCSTVLPGFLGPRLSISGRKQPHRASRAQARAASATTLKRSKADVEEEEEEEEDEEFEDLDSADEEGALTTQQVHTLMNVVCVETPEIAEVELKMGGFTMKVKRKLTAGAAAAPAPLPVADNGAASPPTSANELPFQSTASIDEAQILPAQPANGGSVSSMDEDDYNEHLVYLGAPKVGVLRRGRYMKGKKIGKGNVAEEGSRVKKGQALAYIEQLGTYVPVNAPQAGEIVSFNIEDGVAVEYKEVVVEMAPFFGGHIIGDKKYA